MTALDTYSIAPFANQVSVVPEIPRSQIKELLERGVASVPAADGGFMQVAGVNFAYNPDNTAQEVDEDGAVLTPGERVRHAILHDGTVVVENGEVVDGPAITVATNDFSARGGDMYPFRDADFTVVGSTYQGALERFLTTTLEGRVSAEDYPEGGSGRIVVGEEATVPPGDGNGGGDGDGNGDGNGGGEPTDPPASPGPSDGPTDGTDGKKPGGSDGKDGKGDDKDKKAGTLPVTGGALTGLIIAAVVAVGAGGSALYLSRKRKPATDVGGLDG